jgi:hypothetical protein
MVKYYEDETFKPKTNEGKELKRMVENGDHCDGNIYWLIKQLEYYKQKYQEAITR